jgi:hypothetical protein
MSSETELGRKVVSYLVSEGWEVFQEVQYSSHTRRADIVARRGSIVWVIELKNSLSLDVISQAMEWTGWAHLISVAVPSITKWTGGRYLGERILKEKGIGLITVEFLVFRCEWGRFDRKPQLLPRLQKALIDERKTYAEAGSQHNYYTSFRATTDKLRKYLGKAGEATMKEIVEQIDHHYNSDSTARACLTRWIKEGVIEGIGSRTTGRITVYFVKA